MFLSTVLLLSPAMAGEQFFTALSPVTAPAASCTNGGGPDLDSSEKEFELVLTQPMIDGMQASGPRGVYVAWDPWYSLDMFLNSGAPTNSVSFDAQLLFERAAPVVKATFSFSASNLDNVDESMGMNAYHLRPRAILQAQPGDVLRITSNAQVAVDCTGTGLSQSYASVDVGLLPPKLYW